MKEPLAEPVRTTVLGYGIELFFWINQGFESRIFPLRLHPLEPQIHGILK